MKPIKPIVHKGFLFEMKDLTDSGRFSGLASTYNSVDLGDDLIEPGAFTKTLQQRGPDRPLLWSHDDKSPIGKATLTDSSSALLLDGQLCMDLPLAKETLVLMKQGIVRGLSIGFQSMRDEVVDGVRHLKEIALWEVSLCCFPMNESALVTQVKNQGQVEEAAAAVRLLQEFRADFQKAFGGRS